MVLHERHKGEVLIVSDRSGWGATLAEQLEASGYSPFLCEDPDQAREYLEYAYTQGQYNPPRLMLAEVDGNSISGSQREFLAYLINKARQSHTPVLVWDNSDSFPEPLYEIGVNAVLTPPEVSGHPPEKAAEAVLRFWLDISIHRLPRNPRQTPSSGKASGSMSH